MYNFKLCAPRLPYKLSEHCSVPANVRQKLKDFQLGGVQFLYDHRQQFCILNDESGLGKTVTLAAYLGAVLNKEKCLIIVGDENSLASWEYHLNVLTSVEVTVVKTTEVPAGFGDTGNSRIFVISWSVLFRNEISKHTFDFVVVDNRTNALDNVFCQLFLSKTYENKVNVYVSSADVMRDVKLLHFVLRLGGRLESELVSLKKFEDKFKLPEMINLKNSVDLEEYVLKRQILKDYCGDFTLRRYRHQFNEIFPLTEPDEFKLHLELWCQNNQIRDRHISMKVQHSHDNQDQDRTGLALANIIKEVRANINQNNADREETDEVCNMSPLLLESDSDDDENAAQCKESKMLCIVLDSDTEISVEPPKETSNAKEIKNSKVPEARSVEASGQDIIMETMTTKEKTEKIQLMAEFKMKEHENKKSKEIRSLGLRTEEIPSEEVRIEKKRSVEARPKRKITIETISERKIILEKISENMRKHENIPVEKKSEETENIFQKGTPMQKTSKEKASRAMIFEENMGRESEQKGIKKIRSEENNSIGNVAEEKLAEENKFIGKISKKREYNNGSKETRSTGEKKKLEDSLRQNKSFFSKAEKEELDRQDSQLATPLRKLRKKITEKRLEQHKPVKNLSAYKRPAEKISDRENLDIRNMEKEFINVSSITMESLSQKTNCNKRIDTNLTQKRSEEKALKTCENDSSIAHGSRQCLRSRKEIVEKICEKNSSVEKVAKKETPKKAIISKLSNVKGNEPMVVSRKSRRKTIDPSVEPKILRSTRLTTRSGRILHVLPLPKKLSKTRKKSLVKSHAPQGHKKIPIVASQEVVVMSSSEYETIECAQKLSGDLSNSQGASTSENMWNTPYTIMPSISLSSGLDVIPISLRSSTEPAAPLNAIELSGSSLDSRIFLSTPKVQSIKPFPREKRDQLARSPDLFTSNGITSVDEYAQSSKVLSRATGKQTDGPVMKVGPQCKTTKNAAVTLTESSCSSAFSNNGEYKCNNRKRKRERYVTEKCDPKVVEKKLNVKQTRQGSRAKQQQSRNQEAICVRGEDVAQIGQDARDGRQEIQESRHVIGNRGEDNSDSVLKALERRKDYQDRRYEGRSNKSDTKKKTQEAASCQQDNTQHGVATTPNDIDENIQSNKITRYMITSPSQNPTAVAGAIELMSPNRKAMKAKLPNQSNKLTRWLLSGCSK